MDYRHRFAKDLRTRMTDAERLLWKHLRAHRLNGQKFRRQQPIGPYIVDFVHLGERLIIEADGGQHNDNAADQERDDWLNAEGYRVMRFWNNDILQNTDAVLEEIFKAVSPSPCPSPLKGEGTLQRGGEKDD